MILAAIPPMLPLAIFGAVVFFIPCIIALVVLCKGFEHTD